jgi:hypothetical protein
MNSVKNGKLFETQTSIIPFLLCKKFKFNNSLSIFEKNYEDVKIVFPKNFSKYAKTIHNIEFKIRKPDESFFVYNSKKNQIKIIEKKFQNCKGSSDQKLYAGLGIKLEYCEYFKNFEVDYVFCLSDWYKQDFYKPLLNRINNNFNIKYFFASDELYFENIYHWIKN